MDAIGYMCGVKKCSVGFFDHTGRSDAHRYLGLGVLPTVLQVYSRWSWWSWLQWLRNHVLKGLVESYWDAIGDICEVKIHSLVIFEQTGRDDDH